jgi:hypothetical protein
MVQLSAMRCSCIAILWVSLVSFAAITLCVASRRVFIVISLSTQPGNFWIHPRTYMHTPSFRRTNEVWVVRFAHASNFVFLISVTVLFLYCVWRGQELINGLSLDYLASHFLPAGHIFYILSVNVAYRSSWLHCSLAAVLKTFESCLK